MANCGAGSVPAMNARRTSSTGPATNGTISMPCDVISAASGLDTAPQMSVLIPEAAISCVLNGGNGCDRATVPLRSKSLLMTSKTARLAAASKVGETIPFHSVTPTSMAASD